MNTLHKYILRQLLRNLFLTLSIFTLLFIVLDFFERIDNIMAEGASLWLALQYFAFKIPLTISLMLPVAMLITTVLTFGLLARNSELIAMRSSGLKLIWIARPALLVGVGLSLVNLLLSETLVPYTQRRAHEIYNIDIRKKDKKGGYSQEDFWWREKERFYSIDTFDSRTNKIYNMSMFEISPDFKVARRTEAGTAQFLDPLLGWSMANVKQYDFGATAPDSLQDTQLKIKSFAALPLPIRQQPEDFYDTKTDTQTMNYRQLRRFIREQGKNGIKVSGYFSDLYSKFSFPFSSFIVVLAALPFSLKSARSGSLAVGFIASLAIGFSYYAVHSLSLALGRAELWPPILAAWMANILIGFVGIVLNLGAEAP